MQARKDIALVTLIVEFIRFSALPLSVKNIDRKADCFQVVMI